SRSERASSFSLSVAPLTIWNRRTQPISQDGRPSSISLFTIRGCQSGSALKSRITAQTFSTGASITLETVTLAIPGSLPADAPREPLCFSRKCRRDRQVIVAQFQTETGSPVPGIAPQGRITAMAGDAYHCVWRPYQSV